MNIVKLQNELKSVPDNALIGYVQNPTGQVPSYLALSELQRRKEMRAKYQAAQPEKTTVAEDLAAPPQPQGIAAIQQPAQAPVAEPGVAGLPVPDQMFSGQGMAAGGIVAFADGGETSMNLDRLPSLNVNTGEQISADRLAGGRQMNPLGQIIYKFASMGSLKPTIGEDKQTQDFFYSPHIQYGTDPQTQQFRKLIETGKMAGGGEVKGFAGLDGSYISPNFYTASPDQSSAMADVQRKIEEGKRQAAAIALKKSQQGIPLTMDEKALLQERGVVNAMSGATAASPIDLPGTINIAKAPVAPAVKPIVETVKPVPPVVTNPYDIGMPRQMTIEEAMKREQEAMKLAGVDTEFYKKQMEEMAKDREALGKDRTQAGWMALARAGLGMAAGKSPFALQNIATGATEGLEQFGRETKDLRAEQRLLKAADLKLAEAQNAQQRGDAQSALKAIQEREKLIGELQARKISAATTIEAAKIGAGSRAGIDEDTLVKGFNKAVEMGEYKNTPEDYLRYKSLFTTGAALPPGVKVTKNK